MKEITSQLKEITLETKTAIKNLQIKKFFKDKFKIKGSDFNNLSLSKIKLYQKEITKHINQDKINIMKIHYFNHYNIEDKYNIKDFSNDNVFNEIDNKVLDFKDILKKIKTTYLVDKSDERINQKGIICEYIETKEAIDLLNILQKEFKQDLLFQGYYFSKNIDINIDDYIKDNPQLNKKITTIFFKEEPIDFNDLQKKIDSILKICNNSNSEDKQKNNLGS